jgi:hypothetical protein
MTSRTLTEAPLLTAIELLVASMVAALPATMAVFPSKVAPLVWAPGSNTMYLWAASTSDAAWLNEHGASRVQASALLPAAAA